MQRSERSRAAAAAALATQAGLVSPTASHDAAGEAGGEFPFSCRLTGLLTATVSMWDAHRLARLSGQDLRRISTAIDGMGELSMRAQGIAAPVTSTARLRSTQQRLYMYAEQRVPIGILKVGVKRLFVRDRRAAMQEIAPLCVLDFYVHESRQRAGVGRALFDAMLAEEMTRPARLAYDRPSPKLLGFLAKHFALTRYVPQSNNFVVFDDYFAVTGASPPHLAAGMGMRPALSSPPQQRQLGARIPCGSGALSSASSSSPPPSSSSSLLPPLSGTATSRFPATPLRAPFMRDGDDDGLGCVPSPARPRSRPAVCATTSPAVPHPHASSVLADLLHDTRLSAEAAAAAASAAAAAATASASRSPSPCVPATRRSARNSSSFVFDEEGVRPNPGTPLVAHGRRRSNTSSPMLARLTSPATPQQSLFFARNPDKVTNVPAQAWYSPLGGVAGHGASSVVRQHPQPGSSMVHRF